MVLLAVLLAAACESEAGGGISVASVADDLSTQTNASCGCFLWQRLEGQTQWWCWADANPPKEGDSLCAGLAGGDAMACEAFEPDDFGVRSYHDFFYEGTETRCADHEVRRETGETCACFNSF